jgi:hypothetical protein
MRGMTEKQVLKEIREKTINTNSEYHFCFNGNAHNVVVERYYDNPVLGICPEIIAVYTAYVTPKGNIRYTQPTYKA